MKVKYLFYLGLFFVFFSCNILPKKDAFYTTSVPAEIGCIASKKKSIFKTEVQVGAIPKYTKLIRVHLTLHEFSKKTTKNFLSTTKNVIFRDRLLFSDSLKTKPKYAEIFVDDIVGILHSLNEENTAVLEYLKRSSNMQLISGMRFFIDESIYSKIKNADAFYFKTDIQKKQRIFLYKNQVKTGELSISKDAVFGLQLSSFCWSVDSRKKVKITTIVNRGESCSEGSHKKAKTVEEKAAEKSYKF